MMSGSYSHSSSSTSSTRSNSSPEITTRPKPKHLFCLFCKSNREDSRFYTTHSLKDTQGRVTCPVLYRYVCPNCGATGSDAHTQSYCPTSKDFKAEIGFEKRVVVKPMYDADLRTASGPGRNETIIAARMIRGQNADQCRHQNAVDRAVHFHSTTRSGQTNLAVLPGKSSVTYDHDIRSCTFGNWRERH